MKTPEKYRSWFGITIIFFALSCTNNDPNSDCGCEGSTTETIKDEPASYRGNGRFIVFSQDAKNLKYALACKIDSTWQAAINNDSANYVISGRYKRRCVAPEDLYSSSRPSWPLEITTMQKK